MGNASREHATFCDEVILPVNGRKKRKIQETERYGRHETGLAESVDFHLFHQTLRMRDLWYPFAPV